MRRQATKRREKNGPSKRKALAAIAGLPANATIEDAIERLLLLAKIERGLAQVRDGKAVDHAEVRRRLLR
jgi:predicted transcriptional regulator